MFAATARRPGFHPFVYSSLIYIRKQNMDLKNSARTAVVAGVRASSSYTSLIHLALYGLTEVTQTHLTQSHSILLRFTFSVFY